VGCANGRRIAKLFFSFASAEGQHRDLAPVLLDKLHRTFDGTLLVWARCEPEVRRIDVGTIRGDIDLGAGSRHSLHTNKNLHKGQLLRRVSSGSKAEPLPTTLQG